MKTTRAKSIFALILASVIWGISFLSIKVAVLEIKPICLALIRFSIATIVLFFILKLQGIKEKIKKEHYLRLILGGFFGVTGYYALQNNGVLRLPASIAALIIATIPLFTVLLERVLYKKKLGKVKIFAVLLSLFGVYLTLGLTSGVKLDLLGILCMFGSVFAWILFGISTEPLYSHYSQLTIVFYQTLFGTILFIPLLFIEGISTINWSFELGANLIFLGAICSAMGYYLYVYALKTVGITTASLFLNLLPIVTLLCSAAFLGEKMTQMQVIGALIVLLSVCLVNLKIDVKKIKSVNSK